MRYFVFRVSSRLKVSVGILAVFCLFSSSLVHAGGWIEQITTNGCIAYEWQDTQDPSYKREPETYSWSGQCKPGEVISGKGTFTIKDKYGTGTKTGEYKDGVPHGSFSALNSSYPNNKLRPTFFMGCMQPLSNSDCSPRAARPAKVATETTSKTARYGALSIDRMQGNTYGWSVDEASLAQAREKSLSECNKFSSSPCATVMDFGNTCASYAIDSARSSSVYGWAYAPTKPEADAAALQACGQRGGNGSQCMLRVWGCTSNAVQAGKR
jgi:hypothetical protein